ncbi:hypothetical protein, partial [Candidatus Ichthyocystis sparus]|uniref:hypothetical protein n=1 Tax=Candidatus Ichthyocystis sparus TaxID=1561004 RepID=UPI00159EBC4A
PDFIRSLAGIRVLSSSSDRNLVPLSGGELLSFLSKLDCAIRDEVESIFSLEWDRVADSVFAELEDGSLGDVGCGDFINVLDVVGVPVATFSMYQRYVYPRRVISKGRSLGSGSSECAVDVTESRCGASVDVSPSAFTIDSDVLSSLGVTLSPESVRVIEDLFFKVDVFSRRTYRSMVARQLPSEVSGKLTVTGRGIWYLTYRVMCEDSFVFRCLCEYHAKHRPVFIRALPSIQVLSDSPDHNNVAPLAGDRLLDFLSRLDCAVRGKVGSIFNFYWSEASVTLEEDSLNTVSCKDLINLLDTAGIPPLALSVIIATNSKHERNKGVGKRTTSKTNVTGITSSLTSSSQLLSLQSNPELSPRAHSQSESQMGSSLPLGESPGTSSELIKSSFIGDHDYGKSSSNQYVDLLGVKLHHDNAKLVFKLLYDINKSFRMSFSYSMRGHILSTLGSELSVVGKAIWCKTYREQHLYRFMYRSICMYHARYRPRFVRALDGVQVLSSSSDCKLVPLSGGKLLGFLSELDCAVRKTVEYMFDSLWNETTSTVFAEPEDVLLNDVSCEDFIGVLD